MNSVIRIGRIGIVAGLFFEVLPLLPFVVPFMFFTHLWPVYSLLSAFFFPANLYRFGLAVHGESFVAQYILPVIANTILYAGLGLVIATVHYFADPRLENRIDQSADQLKTTKKALTIATVFVFITIILVIYPKQATKTFITTVPSIKSLTGNLSVVFHDGAVENLKIIKIDFAGGKVSSSDMRDTMDSKNPPGAESDDAQGPQLKQYCANVAPMQNINPAPAQEQEHERLICEKVNNKYRLRVSNINSQQPLGNNEQYHCVITGQYSSTYYWSSDGKHVAIGCMNSEHNTRVIVFDCKSGIARVSLDIPKGQDTKGILWNHDSTAFVVVVQSWTEDNTLHGFGNRLNRNISTLDNYDLRFYRTSDFQLISDLSIAQNLERSMVFLDSWND